MLPALPEPWRGSIEGKGSIFIGADASSLHRNFTQATCNFAKGCVGQVSHGTLAAMNKHNLAGMMVALAIFTISTLSSAEANKPTAEQAVTVEDVQALQALIPPEAHPHGKPAGFERAGEAKRVALAIAKGARSSEEAALAAVYAAYEASNEPKAEGDGHKSFGLFQLNGERTPKECAFDPDCAFGVWKALKDDAETRCARNPPEERLAVIASGSCDLARAKVRVRYQIAARVLAELWQQENLPKE